MAAAQGVGHRAAHRRARPRWRLGLCLGLTIALGLLSRRWPLPGLLAEYPGDALYTVAAAWGLLLLRPRWPGVLAAVLALLFSATVEFSQLWSPAWLAELRATGPGALLLGQGFQAADLAAYAVGAVVIWGLDRALFRSLNVRSTSQG